ncbi:MAG: low molecular weight phosphatase family protein [Candidatus Aenigmarchaeota archaeon]|nr:low molecular weight phosphatase family protein [Candidatus Aenigmarchaeota archaeon]
MKVLFVCRGNVGRSQMAAELFTKCTGIKADSAGTLVEAPGSTLQDLWNISPGVEPIVRFMKEEGCDATKNVRRQITPEMASGYDRIIVMAEMETVPDYLRENKATEFWEVEDPKGMDDEGYRKVIADIKRKIGEFVERNKLPVVCDFK